MLFRSVLCGDALIDLDLSEAVRRHKAKGAMASLITKRVPREQVSSYGVVVTDEEGRVLSFQEKPSIEEAASDTINNTDRTNLKTEFTSLYNEIDRITNATQFNGVAILTGGSTAVILQIGANTSTLTATDNQFSLNITPSAAGNFYMSSLSPTMTDMGVTSQSLANLAISSIDVAINAVSTARTSVGSLQSRLESATRTLGVAAENAAAANSRIADADIAQSMSELVRAQILQQAGISVLAQANQAPSLVLQLLK